MKNDTFQNVFSSQPDASASAPGRVNLIGEHTDYNGGFVLPVTIPFRTRVDVKKRGDQKVRLASTHSIHAHTRILEYELGDERPGKGWIDYVQGLTTELRAAGFHTGGFEMKVQSDVPVGAGLSSSAALEVSTLRALRQVYDLPLDDLRIAILGQKAENNFVGAKVGIMDQFTSSLGIDHKALRIDTRSLDYEHIPLPAAMDLIVINSGIKHSNRGGDYNTRRAECEEASKLLNVNLLREVGIENLPEIEKLPPPLDRRARHVVTENHRVLLAVDALKNNDLKSLGNLFYESHASMRLDYEITIPEIDLLIELAKRENNIYGARMTGGGFGGCVIMLSPAGAGSEIAARIIRSFKERSGKHAQMLMPVALSGEQS